MWIPFWGGTSKPKLSQEDQLRLKRKCGQVKSGYEGCMKANGVEGAAACRGLETRLIECYGEVVCPAQAEAFQACYSAAVNKPGPLDIGSCDGRLKDMQQYLKKQGLWPLP